MCGGSSHFVRNHREQALLDNQTLPCSTEARQFLLHCSLVDYCTGEGSFALGMRSHTGN